jgi:hypothetical protein
MWMGAAAFGALAGVACGVHAAFGSVIVILLSAVAGALGGAALFDALEPLLPALLFASAHERGATMVSSTAVNLPEVNLPAGSGAAAGDTPSSAWNFDYHESEPDDAWISDPGRSQVAWAEATLAARDAWERAARNSRTRVVLGKRVILGDPPPRSGDDT